MLFLNLTLTFSSQLQFEALCGALQSTHQQFLWAAHMPVSHVTSYILRHKDLIIKPHLFKKYGILIWP